MLGALPACQELVDVREPVPHGVERGALQVQVERREHIDASWLRGDTRERLGDLLTDHVHEVRRLVVHGARHDSERLFDCRLGHLGRDELLIGHRLQYDVAAFDRPLGIGKWRPGAWALNHAGNQRRLAEAQVGDILAEEEPRRLGNTMNGKGAALSQVDVVEIQLENLVLGRPPFEDERHDRFA